MGAAMGGKGGAMRGPLLEDDEQGAVVGPTVSLARPSPHRLLLLLLLRLLSFFSAAPHRRARDGEDGDDGGGRRGLAGLGEEGRARGSHGASGAATAGGHGIPCLDGEIVFFYF